LGAARNESNQGNSQWPVAGKSRSPRPLRGRGMTNHEVYGTVEAMCFQISLKRDFIRNL
jgi:hypothetical protein